MKSSVYDYLNDMDNRPDSYSFSAAEPGDVKRWKKSFDTRRGKTGAKWRKYAAAAAALAIVAVAGSILPVGQTVYAGVKAVTYELSQMLGIEKDLDPYRTVVGKSLTKDGFTITLNEVILDRECLYISDTLTVPEAMNSPEDMMNYDTYIEVYINGRKVSNGAGGGSRQADEYNIVSDMLAEIPGVDTDGTLDVEIQYEVLGGDSAFGDISMGGFEFTASGQELSVNTLSVPLDQTFVLPDGETVKFTEYTSNALGQKIYYEKSAAGYSYDIELRGEDNLGNPVSFYVRAQEGTNGRMEVESIDNGYISDDASSLTLALYAVEMPKESGKMPDASEYEQVGEAFTVQL